MEYDKVSSEVHEFGTGENNLEGAVLSRFDFKYPSTMVDTEVRSDENIPIDSDGDSIVVRKDDVKRKESEIIIEHRLNSNRREHHSSTTLDLVGEQVWRGALFLADFILHHHKLFKDAHVLELAAGVGMTSVVAAKFAASVTATDMDKGDMLTLIHKNVKRNEDHIVANVRVKELDFYDSVTIQDLSDCDSPTIEEIEILLAADVVYHNQLTDAFFNSVLKLMCKGVNKVLYLALEKRFVFTLEDMDTVAPCYEYFLTQLEWLKGRQTDTICWNIEQVGDFPQYFTYERNIHLVLWKIEGKHI